MRRTLNDSNVAEYGAKFSTAWKVATIAALLALCLGMAAPARAEVTFGASVTNANGTLSTVLTWSAPGATGCTAAGHSSWTGAKPAASPAGGFALPPIAMSGSYTLSLSCTKPAVTTAIVTWKPPVANGDGSPYVTGKGFKIYYNTGGETMVTAPGGQVVTIATPTATTYTINGLTPGTWNFGVSAINARDVEGGIETRNEAGLPAAKVISATAVENASPIVLTVNPIPGKATNVAAQ